MSATELHSVYICDAVRTPIGRFGGALSRVRTDDLAAAPIAELAARHPKAVSAVEEVVLGCVNQSGEDNRNVARMASLLAGLDESVPAVTVNRLCGSGMDAVAGGHRSICDGSADLVIVGGVESMSRAPFVIPKAEKPFQRSLEAFDTTIGWRMVNPRMEQLQGTDSMPETAENVARDFNISRADQDAYAYRSQQRTAAARDAGFLAEEIMPIATRDARGAAVEVSEDEHPRPGTSLEALAKLGPVAGGTVTAGNSAGVNDGAIAMILASSRAVEAHGLVPRARILGFASAGVAARVMGMGPVPAVRKLLSRLDLTCGDFDVIELNEAFASQVVACLRELGIPEDAEHVNAYGGAIALGHPLGMSGARLVDVAVRGLARQDKKLGLATMCVGVGQGVAMAVERVA